MITFFSLALVTTNRQTNRKCSSPLVPSHSTRQMSQEFSKCGSYLLFCSHVFINNKVGIKTREARRKSNQIYRSLCQALRVFALHAIELHRNFLFFYGTIGRRWKRSLVLCVRTRLKSEKEST